MPKEKTPKETPRRKSAVSPAADPVDIFRPLFLAARAAMIKTRENSSAEAPAYQGALVFAQAQHLPWAVALLEGLLLSYQAEPEAALLRLDLAGAPLSFHGEIWFLRGRSEDDLNHWDRAIECYQNALASPDFTESGGAWNNMGCIHHRKQEYTRAFECYQKALATPNFMAPGMTWHNMGLAYSAMHEYDRATECYRSALASPDYDSPGEVWINMGNSLRENREYARAIDCYQKALASQNQWVQINAWVSMGTALTKNREPRRAIDCWDKAIALLKSGS